MKYYISNCGNLIGSDITKENTPDYIQTAINNGFYCLADVLYLEGVLYFGRTNHLYIIDLDFIVTPFLI